MLVALMMIMLAGSSEGAIGARPLEPLGSLFGPDAYPPEARDAGAGGRVAATLKIAADGRVAGCTVTQSSASAALDAATCEIVVRRARFAPARDAAGKAMAGKYNLRVDWMVAEAADILPTGRITATMDRGRVTACSATGTPVVPLARCEQAIPAAMLARYFGEASVDIRRAEVAFVRQPGERPVAPSASTGRSVRLLEVVITVGADRRIAACRVRTQAAGVKDACLGQFQVGRGHEGPGTFGYAIDLNSDLPSQP